MKKLISGILAISMIVVWTPSSFAVDVGAGPTAGAGATAYTFNVDGATLTIADTVTIGAVDVTAANPSGTMTFSGTSGGTTVGATGARLLAFNVGTATTLSGDMFATTTTIGTGTFNSDSITGTTINFTGAGTLSVDPTENISAAVTTSANNQGTLTLEGATTLTGQVGSSSVLDLAVINVGADATTSSFSAAVFSNLINITGDATNVTFSGDVTGTLDFDNGAVPTAITFADGSDLTGAVTITTAGEGQLTIAGTSTFSSTIGTNVLYMGNIVSSGAAKTLTFGGNVFATDLTQTGAANVLNIGANTVDLNGAADGDYFLVDGGAGTLALTITNRSTFGNILANGATGTADVEAADTLSITVGSSASVFNGQTFAIITSTDDSVAAVPGTITDNSIFFSFAATEPTAGDIVLTATLNTANVAKTANSATALTSLDSALATGATSDLASVANTLYAMTDSALATAALDTLDPVSNAGVNNASFTAVNKSIGALNSHLGEVNSGGSGSGVSTGDFWTDNGFWVKGYGSTADQDARDGANGYDADLWGATGGFDGLIQENFRVGIAGGYAQTEIENKGEAGGTDIDSIQGTIYMRYDDPSPWYVNGGFSFNWNMYDGTRAIAVGSINRTAKADYDGQQYTGFFDGGYVLEVSNWEPNQVWNVIPTAGLTYSHLDLEDYTETEADSLNLLVASQDYDLLQSSLGVKLERPWSNDSGKFVPEVHFKWLYDFIGDEAATTATFSGGGSSFSTRGADPAQHSFNVGAGIAFYTKGNFSITGTYDFEIKSDYTSHTGQGVVRWTY